MWDTVFNLFGLTWVMPKRVVDLLSCWQGKMGRHRNIEIWRAIPHCLMWCLWKERNARLFEANDRNVLFEDGAEDEKLLVLLRDGRKLLGILRSFDQFANAVLEEACERVIVGDLYCDIPLGLYIIRGENVVLIGELDLEREELPPHMTRVSAAEIKRAQKAEREASDLKGTMRKRMEFLDLD
uniref:U6 snRNA-associated Sm-like protein LSm1 n=1 Tax=Fagus sylvatica TaxID=28930 RepID=A0A2N9I5U4_FAGSY